jgi:hypothetical protein
MPDKLPIDPGETCDLGLRCEPFGKHFEVLLASSDRSRPCYCPLVIVRSAGGPTGLTRAAVTWGCGANHSPACLHACNLG